jgi:hypothetical protein
MIEFDWPDPLPLDDESWLGECVDCEAWRLTTVPGWSIATSSS